MKNAQSSLEYLMIIGLTFGIIIPTIYLFFTYTKESNVQIVDAQLSSIGRNIVNTAESIYYSGEHARIILEFNMPENVDNVFIIAKRELIFKVETEFGDTDIVFFSDVNITGHDDYCETIDEISTCELSFMTSQGYHKIRIESISGGFEVLIDQESG